MSIEMFIRKPDGTAWEGRIILDWESVREHQFSLEFSAESLLYVESAMQEYGTCQALNVKANHIPTKNPLTTVYRFLYGFSFEELMEKESPKYHHCISWINKPKEWTIQEVKQMNWNHFCLAYYSFLYSPKDFKSKAWETMAFVLKTLKDDSEILCTLLSNADRECNETAQEDFWETVYNGLVNKILGWLSDESCYTSFYAMTCVRNLLSPERYRKLEHRVYEALNKIVLERINELHENTYTVKELINFTGELTFFFKEYFEASDLSRKNKKYFTSSVFKLLTDKADKILLCGDLIGADDVYEAALKFAENDADYGLIYRKRTEISKEVANLRTEKEKNRLKDEQKRIKAERKERVTDIIVHVCVGLLIVAVLCIIVFGLFSMFNIFNPFSKTIALISLGIVAFFSIGIFISERKRK